jgi:hypothetical protein
MSRLSLPRNCSVEFRPERFFCHLDDQPDHLTPAHSLRAREQIRVADRPLFLNPRCRFTAKSELPDGLLSGDGLAECFDLEHEIAWVPDQATGALQPFWLGDGLTGLSLERPGEPLANGLHPVLRSSLQIAGVLISGDFAEETNRRWSGALARRAVEFVQHGYAPVAGLVHPFHLSALRRYYRYHIRTGRFPLGDDQTARRYAAHNEPVARFFHRQLCAPLSAIARQPLKPSYVYFASYQGGAELEKHTDRPQCDYSLTFCIDYSPEPRCATPWPLRLHTDAGLVRVFQAIGDGLFYRGCQIPHSRDRLPQGHTSTSLFFHYVREDYAGPLD